MPGHSGINLRFIILIGILVILIIAMFLTSEERTGLSKIEVFFRDLIAPVQSWVNKVCDSVVDAFSFIGNIRNLSRENRVLKNQVEELTYLNNSLNEAKAENERLRRLLEVSRMIPYDKVVAEVIARSPDNWYSNIVINKGYDDGIRKDMAVITHAGLVGKISEVTKRTATVLLLTDPRSAVGGLNQRTRDIVLVEGSAELKNHLLLKPLDDMPELHKGDVVISSGLGGIFPKGLVIGKIVVVEKGDFGMTTTAVVEPAVDFGKLEYVMVIRETVRDDQGVMIIMSEDDGANTDTNTGLDAGVVNTNAVNSTNSVNATDAFNTDVLNANVSFGGGSR